MKENNDKSLETYQDEKLNLRSAFNELKKRYIDNNKAVTIGDKLVDIYDCEYEIDNIVILDTLESRRKNISIEYQGVRIGKNGRKTNKRNILINFRDIDKKEFPINDYFKEKAEILNRYRKLKRDYRKSSIEYKKGDRVIDSQNDIYIIAGTDFYDSFDSSHKPYISYFGRKLLKSGKLAEKINYRLLLFKKISY